MIRPSGDERPHRPLPAAPTYEAGGAVGDLHETISRRLAAASDAARRDRPPFETLCRIASVTAGYAALGIGTAALLAATILR